mgnify:CR=1 FL=1
MTDTVRYAGSIRKITISSEIISDPVAITRLIMKSAVNGEIDVFLPPNMLYYAAQIKREFSLNNTVSRVYIKPENNGTIEILVKE